MNEHPDLALFLGRFHPLLVHLPIGCLLLLVALESLARVPRFRRANDCAGYMLAFLVPVAVVAAACGWLLAGSGDYDPGLLRAHRWLGVGTVALSVLAGVLRWQRRLRTYAITLYVNAGVLALVGHYGGSLTHGSGYLARYAPAPLRSLLGEPARDPDPMPASAGLGRFPNVIQSLLELRCGACHHPEKRKGGLRVDSMDALLQGGDSGPAIVPGDAAGSRLMARLLLPLADDDHMPPEGRTQLTAEEIALLTWWIEAGAPADGGPSERHPPASVRQTIERMPQTAR